MLLLYFLLRLDTILSHVFAYVKFAQLAELSVNCTHKHKKFVLTLSKFYFSYVSTHTECHKIKKICVKNSLKRNFAIKFFFYSFALNFKKLSFLSICNAMTTRRGGSTWIYEETEEFYAWQLFFYWGYNGACTQ